MGIKTDRLPPLQGRAAALTADCGSAAQYEALRDIIRADIANGTLQPGERLVVEQLRHRYGASGQPIRDALNQLQGEGFVVVSPNRGASVRVIDEDFVRNIFEIRSLLEPFLARRYCELCTTEMLQDLQRAQASFEKAVENRDLEAVEAANTEFHDRIFRVDSNTEAVEVLLRYAGMLQAYRDKLPVTPYRTRARIDEHHRMIAALTARDPGAAAAAAEAHVRAAGDDFLKAMRQARVSKVGTAARTRAAIAP